MFFLAVTVVFGKSQENIIDITFNKLGAVYHKNESGNSVCKVIKANNDITYKVVVEIVDIDKKPIGYKKTYTLSSPFERYYYVPFQFSELGYYYLSVSFLHGDKVIFSKQEGFGVIPDVTLTKKDYDSPFGVGAHYARYGDWRVAEIQQALGIAWVRDVARWKDFIGTARNTPDPFIDYLDRHNICWLPILDYVDANHGWQDENGIWRWDEDVTNIKKYVEMNENRILVYESQNEPSNFAGWNKRWPHPQGQKWRPQGWGVPFTDLVKQMHDSIKAVNGDIKLIWPGEEEWIEYFDDNREDVANHIDFTANDAYPVAKGKRPPLYSNSITASHYALDSHAVHKREKGKIALDGFFNYQASVYTVPFGVILPKKVNNLLIPVPASATHVGFSTLRMEPCWMALGQAAGIAAALAIEQNKSVKELDIEDIQAELLKEKTTLMYFKDITVDSPDFEMVQYMGLRGYITDWVADLDGPMDRDTAKSWSTMSGITIEKFKGKSRRDILQAVYDLIR